jgi:hypothetical protein
MTRGEAQARKPGEKLQALKGLFQKKQKGAAQEAPTADRPPDTQQLLAQAQSVLQKLRTIDARNPEAFPLLNECTRCGEDRQRAVSLLHRCSRRLSASRRALDRRSAAAGGHRGQASARAAGDLAIVSTQPPVRVTAAASRSP